MKKKVFQPVKTEINSLEILISAIKKTIFLTQKYWKKKQVFNNKFGSVNLELLEVILHYQQNQ